MALRLPGQVTPERAAASTGVQPIEHEILSEMAVSLGRAGERAARALEELARIDAGGAATGQSPRENALREAAMAVHAWFIQREICGMRRHDDVIKELKIPRAVLVRLGVR